LARNVQLSRQGKLNNKMTPSAKFASRIALGVLAASICFSAAARAQDGSQPVSVEPAATSPAQPVADNAIQAPVAPAAADATSTPTQATATPAAATPAATNTATGKKPLEMQSNEGFWGHMNPMARKKWVNRQTDPIKGRLNELDQLTAKNKNDIADLDARATAGIKQASDTANAANATATDASAKAATAQAQAKAAAARADSLNGTVGNLDQYKPITDAELHFKAGSTVLGEKSKAALDEMAEQLTGQKGYIVQVQGFTRAKGQGGVAMSDQMAEAVVRYLVEKKNVPLYRIYKLGYGSSRPAETTVSSGNVVQVTLLHNSLAEMGANGSTGASAIGATQ